MGIFDFIGNVLFILVGFLLQVFVEKFQNKQTIVNWISFVAASLGMLWLGLEIGTKGAFNLFDNQKGMEIFIPISNWDVNGETIGNSILGDDSYSGEFELSSVQADNTFTIPDKQLTYAWESPASYPELKRMPLRGIQSIISIQPIETKYSAERIFCHYTVRYAGASYMSIEQYVPFDQPVLMTWDFAGKIGPSDFGITGEDFISLENAIVILQKKGVSFTYYTRRLAELWQWQNLVANNYDPNSIEKITMTCNTSATKEYRGGNTGDRFTFKGKFTFGDIIVYPHEQSK